MQHRPVLLAVAALAAMACGNSSSPPNVGYGYALYAVGGVYDDGSGRLGLAVLSTLRSGSGAGPDASWTATLSGPGSLASDFSYPAGESAGSYAAWWWPDVAPAAGSYRVTLGDGGRSLHYDFGVSPGAGLEIPILSLSPDASSIDWALVAGASTYECQIFGSDGSLQLSSLGPSPGCDLSALPPGAYTASALAYSADLAALAADHSQSAGLPASFDVSEARLGVLRPQPGAPAFVAAAAGGAIDYGGAAPGLAFWMSLAQADGTATAVPWTVQVVGPGLPVSAPLTESYGANFPRMLFWDYEVPATPGVYSFTATSTAGALAGTFTVGTPQSLELPQGVVASGGAQGSARVDFGAVTGAQSYLVSAWDHASGAFVASQWVSAPPAQFPQGSFVSGTTYDVYVDATGADMLGGAVPTQVAVSENTYQPTRFVAP